jgi:hypothetical protein
MMQSAAPVIHFSQANYQVLEDLGAMTLTVTRSGDTTAQPPSIIKPSMAPRLRKLTSNTRPVP